MYRRKNMSVIAYANGFTLWHYVTMEDTAVTIAEPNYFKDDAVLMNVGDKILVCVKDGFIELVVVKLGHNTCWTKVLQKAEF